MSKPYTTPKGGAPKPRRAARTIQRPQNRGVRARAATAELKGLVDIACRELGKDNELTRFLVEVQLEIAGANDRKSQRHALTRFKAAESLLNRVVGKPAEKPADGLPEGVDEQDIRLLKALRQYSDEQLEEYAKTGKLPPNVHRFPNGSNT